MTTPPPKDAIRNAATIVLVRRDDAGGARILMGQRGKGAAFMPSKFVFPGGAVDREDGLIDEVADLPAALQSLLEIRAEAGLAKPLAMAAIRELWEETGLALAHPAKTSPSDPPEAWSRFFEAGHMPALDRLHFVFRAITPPGRPRRFDARFFLADAEGIRGDADDFSGAEDELSHLSWLTLAEARRLDLPFITEVVLAEIEARLENPASPRPVPFFHHSDGKSYLDPI
ncbi:MAG: NUDIX hydrolase [Pseudomonadota bacterium]